MSTSLRCPARGKLDYPVTTLPGNVAAARGKRQIPDRVTTFPQPLEVPPRYLDSALALAFPLTLASASRQKNTTTVIRRLARIRRGLKPRRLRTLTPAWASHDPQRRFPFNRAAGPSPRLWWRSLAETGRRGLSRPGHPAARPPMRGGLGRRGGTPVSRRIFCRYSGLARHRL